MRPFGAGRVYYHAFDDSWRWRYEVADLYHVKFWNQLASYIASGYLFKALAALADTLPFYWLTAWLRRWLVVPGVGTELGSPLR